MTSGQNIFCLATGDVVSQIITKQAQWESKLVTKGPEGSPEPKGWGRRLHKTELNAAAVRLQNSTQHN